MKRGGGRRAPARAKAPAGRRVRLPAIGAAILLAAAAAAWLLPQARRPAPAPAQAPDPTAGLTPAAAHRIARELSGEDALASLAYFRRAVAAPGPVQYRVDYAVALRDAALQTRSVRGLGFPATRSSVERMELIRESLAQLDVAERWTTNASGRAAVIHLRAQIFKAWGFPWLCLAELRRAQNADPSAVAYRVEADLYARALRHPDRVRKEDIEP